MTEPSKLKRGSNRITNTTSSIPTKLLQKFVGREVTLVRPKLTSGYDGISGSEKAALLSLNGAPRVENRAMKIVTGLSYESIRFPELPENFVRAADAAMGTAAKFRRAAGTKSKRPTSHRIFPGAADYVLNVGKDESKRRSSTAGSRWVNHSGTAFKNAQLQLVAAIIHREPFPLMGRMLKAMDQIAAGQ